jgi:hypothetical protein
MNIIPSLCLILSVISAAFNFCHLQLFSLEHFYRKLLVNSSGAKFEMLGIIVLSSYCLSPFKLKCNMKSVPLEATLTLCFFSFVLVLLTICRRCETGM